MTALLSRRGVLRCLTGIIAAREIVRVDALMRVVAPKPTWRIVNCSIVPDDWRYFVRIVNIDVTNYEGENRTVLLDLSRIVDSLPRLTPLPGERA